MTVDRRTLLKAVPGALALPATGFTWAQAEAAAIVPGTKVTVAYPAEWDMERLSAFPAGGVIITYRPNGEDVSKCRQYSATLAPVGAPFTVLLGFPVVPVALGGGSTMHIYSEDSPPYDLYAGRYSSSHLVLGAPSVVMEAVGGAAPGHPVATRLASGNVLIVAIAGSDVVSSVVSPGGLRIGSQTTVLGAAALAQELLEVIPLKAGGAVLSYRMRNAALDHFQKLLRLNDAGAAVGAPILVRKLESDYLVSAGVAGVPSGGFVVVWQEASPAGSSNGRLVGRLYSAAGALQKTFTRALPSGQYQYDNVRVAVNAAGRIAVVHRLVSSAVAPRKFTAGVTAFSAAGVYLAGPTAMDTGRYDGPYAHLIAAQKDGSFVVTWHKTASDLAHVYLLARRVTVT